MEGWNRGILDDLGEAEGGTKLEVFAGEAKVREEHAQDRVEVV